MEGRAENQQPGEWGLPLKQRGVEPTPWTVSQASCKSCLVKRSVWFAPSCLDVASLFRCYVVSYIFSFLYILSPPTPYILSPPTPYILSPPTPYILSPPTPYILSPPIPYILSLPTPYILSPPTPYFLSPPNLYFLSPPLHPVSTHSLLPVSTHSLHYLLWLAVLLYVLYPHRSHSLHPMTTPLDAPPPPLSWKGRCVRGWPVNQVNS